MVALVLTAPQRAWATPPQPAPACPVGPSGPVAPAGPVAPSGPVALPPSIVAWGGIASLDAVVRILRVAGERVGLSPAEMGPAAGDLWQQLESSAREQGLSGLGWLQRDQPVRWLVQDDGGQPDIGALVVLLPVTSQAAVLQALPRAELGAEGHAAAYSPPDADQRIYLDFLPGQLVVTFDPLRWRRAAPIASGPAGRFAVPGVVSVGVSVANLTALHPKEVQQLKAGMDEPQGVIGSALGGAAQSAGGIKQLIDELDSAEFSLGGDSEGLQLGLALRARPLTPTDKNLRAGQGRTVGALARLLPAQSYLAVLGNTDPEPGLAQMDSYLAALQAVLPLPKRQRAALLRQMTGLGQGLSGEVALALYPDDDCAFGGLALVGVKDPEAFRQGAAKLAGQLALVALDQQTKSGRGGKPKGPRDPELAKVEAAARKGLAKGSLTPLLQAVAPKAAEAGVVLTQSAIDEPGLKCDAIAVAFDWAKLQADSHEPVQLGPALLGKGLTLAACATRQHAVWAVGPTALRQARRVASGEPGGFAEQAGYRFALQRAVPQPSSLLIFEPARAFGGFQAALAEAELRAAWRQALHGAMPLSSSFGSADGGGAYRLDLPFALLAAAKRGFKLVAEGAPEEQEVVPAKLPPPSLQDALGPEPAPAAKPRTK